MKIVGIETYLASGFGAHTIPFIRVQTDEGWHGIGEAYRVGADMATLKAIAYYGEWLMGRDPMDIEGLWQLIYAGSRFPGGSAERGHQ